jgi:hypothetical protein
MAEGLLWNCVFPNPDGYIGPGDRLQLLGLYRGFLDLPDAGEVVSLTLQLHRTVSLTVER